MEQTPKDSFGFENPMNSIRVMGLCGLLCAMAATIIEPRLMQLGLATAAATLLCLALGMWLVGRVFSTRGTDLLAQTAALVADDHAPRFVTRTDGQMLSQNTAAEKTFENKGANTLAGLLKPHLANPGSVLYRLQSRAFADGAAQEDMITSKGHLRLCAQRLSDQGFLWRVEDLPVRDLAKPAVEGQVLPMLMVGRKDTVLYMNEAARALVGQRVKSLDRIFQTLPLVPGQTCDMQTADGMRQLLMAEVPSGAGRRAMYFLPAPAQSPTSDSWQMSDDLPVPLLKVAPDGAIISFNTSAGRLLGANLKDGALLSQLMEGLGRSITDWLSDTIEGRLTQKSEFLRLTRTDREVFVQVTLNSIVENGQNALIAVLNDATELKSLEAQFVQSQKMQAIGQLAGGVAHDFNNLLTAISGHCDLLLLRHDQGDHDYSDLVQINQNANRAAALVGQLLAFSRKQTLRPETLDMRDTLADLTHLLNRLVGEKVTLTLSHDPVVQRIRADKRQLEQVLMNLVVNARDAMPAGGEIKITTERSVLNAAMTRDRVTVPEGQYVVVQVSDEGSGIPREQLQKVFEPFFTTKRTGEGTGLGLSTAYGIIKQTGGFIFVDSTVGVGTTFTLYFPVLEAEAIEHRPVAPPKPNLTGNQTDGVILLVEDEAPVRAFASRALRLRGYTVLEAASAEAALAMLDDKGLSIDVFVTDVVMPGMDGPTWVREALKQRPDVRVVFVSGYAEDSFGEEQSRIPNSVFLPKPFSLSDLTETVNNQLQ